MSVHVPDPPAASKIDYEAVEKSPEFQQLKRSHHNFVMPIAAGFLIWYFAFVLTAAYAPDFMAIKVLGNINLGIVLGLGQFVTTFGITMWYVSFANRRLDPLGADLRSHLEGQDAQ
ncbi:MAG: DUF485 domain-containing protein [Burkholderiaceae bacterium]|nr:DUF485 domain-containing protein [Microbacteriaceae bacterium]